ncbi:MULTISPECIES: cystathionine beta-lyase [unclassified Sphingomonas]|uniref:cystathionine beta-lyase n=1 Tax=unclassified Sphingomonas TaxID=196159 RepID=UPI0006FE630E|nr:cystathionine beta-lyase [Sphingomonas sp. Root1294]KQY70607.1 cystathionine beta-lyase [Sphingomonas sp. Root50]KRB91902.1 cystathionine beta-lyase [Sphingomonas sp. Root720]
MTDDDGSGLKPGTRLVTAGRHRKTKRGIVNPPVWRASTILFDSVAELRAATRKPDDGLFYGRRGTPTQWSLADALTELEPGAAGTILYPSGVAAIAAVLLSLLEPGDELLMVDSAYEPTRAVCDGLLKRYGIGTRYYDPTIGAGIVELIGDHTRVVFLESPGSLTFEVQDVPAIVAAARARGVTTVIDNSWATPLFFPAIAHGVDISILACTKYIVGHSDVMMGSATAVPGHYERLRRTSHALGQCVSADDAYLAARGLRTLQVRLRQHQEGGLAVARWLAEQPQVARVLHPALPDCRGHDLWKRDFTGASGLFGVVLDGGDDAARTALIDGLDLFGIGFSWGGYESLALPVDPATLRTATRWQAEGPVIRFHIGIEDPADLIDDLGRGLARFESARG